jgi:simple sugar transport system ATP-binding protein
MNGTILEIKNLTKRFAGVTALDDVSMSVTYGEVHALMGENGAGKSTLIKILTGVYRADSGDIYFDGKKTVFKDVSGAHHAGVNAIYQELNMVSGLTVSENIFISRYPMIRSGIDWKTMHSGAQKLIDNIGVDIDVHQPLGNYGTAKQQIVAILRAVSMESKLIIMDEPTSSLDTHEVHILFDIIDKLKNAGISIIFITHRLDEVYKKCDRITVLKDGKCVGTYNIAELSQYELLTKMIGQKNLVMEHIATERRTKKDGPLLEVKDLSRPPYVNKVNFNIKQGEIVGFAGLLGSGRTEIARLLFGCDLPESGEIIFEGKPLSLSSPQDAVTRGMAFCTENRREEGLFPNVTVQNNLAACALPKLAMGGFINLRGRKQLAEEYIKTLAIKTPSDDQLIKNLSGGNQQKVILARWLATKPKFIILDEPTRGIDVGAKFEIEKLIREFSRQNISVLFISSEIAELVRNCDRIIVLRDGMVAGELTGGDISTDRIMQMIAESKIPELKAGAPVPLREGA